MTNSIYRLGSNSRIILISAFIALSGCAVPSPAKFSPGPDQSKYSQDDYECERDARSIRGDACDQMDMFEKCMRAKGYTEIKGSAKKGMCATLF